MPRSRCRTGLLCAGLFSVFCAFSVQAEEQVFDTEITTETVIITQEAQRADLRRALASEFDHETGKARQRLSIEEREALHRDLRNAMRNVNADHDAVGRRQR